MNENEWYLSNGNSEPQPDNNPYACPNCKKIVEQLEIETCPYCGFNFAQGGIIDTATGEKVNYGAIRGTYEKVKNSELVQSIKEDLQNSKSLELVKGYFKEHSGRRKQKKAEKAQKKAEIKELERQMKELKKRK